MLVEKSDLKHEGIDREHAGVVGNYEGRAARRHVLKPAHPDPEPAPVQPAYCGHEHGAVELRVESRLRVHFEVSGQPTPDEIGGLAQPPDPPTGFFAHRQVPHPRGDSSRVPPNPGTSHRSAARVPAAGASQGSAPPTPCAAGPAATSCSCAERASSAAACDASSSPSACAVS